ncbi:MAG: hypothetical protein KDH92_00460, partial [Chloroflexi bacterium]|nr:hypothetical protein [Chloroflexota bacterium]
MMTRNPGIIRDADRICQVFAAPFGAGIPGARRRTRPIRRPSLRLRIPVGLAALLLGIAACGCRTIAPTAVSDSGLEPRPQEADQLMLDVQREAGRIVGRLPDAPKGGRIQIATTGEGPSAEVELDASGAFSVSLGAEALRGARPLTLTLTLPGREARVLERTVPHVRA